MNYRNLLIYIILLAVIDVLIFLFVKDMSIYQITSVAFINVALVCAAVFSELYPKSTNTYIYSVSAGMFAFTYFIIELIMGVAFIATNWENVTVLIVQPVVFVIFLILMIYNVTANFQSAKADNERTKMRKEFTTVLYPNMQNAMDNAKGLDSFKTIEKAYDEVRSLPTRSCDETKMIDDELISSSEELVRSVENKDEENIAAICDKLMKLSNQKRDLLRRKVE